MTILFVLTVYIYLKQIYTEVPEKNENILNYNHGKNSMSFIFGIYADTEFIYEKINTCCNDPEKSPTTRVNKHFVCGYSLLTQCSITDDKNKHGSYKLKAVWITFVKLLMVM